jgi:hypothetical protein
MLVGCGIGGVRSRIIYRAQVLRGLE